jgi:hypothetical protein
LTRFPTGVVHAGDVVELAWSRPAGDVEELEVVLSVDGGGRYAIRVTPELERARDHYTWKVPRLAAAHAHLCVRFGREHDEQLSVPTPEFVIDRAPEAGTAPDLRTAWSLSSARPLDWWDEDDAAPLAAAGPALSGQATLGRGATSSAAGVLPRRAPQAATLLAAAAPVPFEAAGAALALAAPPVAPVPQFVPRRE